MTLTRRAAHEQVHFADGCDGSFLGLAQPRSQATVEPREHIRSVIPDSRVEVSVVDGANLLDQLDRQSNVQPAPAGASRLCDSQGDAPTPGEQVYEANWMAKTLVVGPAT